MNENISQSNVSASDGTESLHKHRVTTAGWIAGVSAVVGFEAIGSNASLGSGIGALGISAMVATVCYFILRGR